MAPRAVVTPNDLSNDFLFEAPDAETLEELGLDADEFEPRAEGRMILNLFAGHFRRDNETNEIRIKGVGDGGLVIAIANCEDVILDSLAAGDTLIWVLAAGEVPAHWENAPGLSAAGIKALYESNDDTNCLTDALLTKLNGIEAGAQVNLSTATIIANIDASLTSTSWRQPATVAVRVANYLADATDFVRERVNLMNMAGANTFTVPPALSITLLERCTVMQMGAGATTIVAGAGVTLIAGDDALQIRDQGCSAQIVPTGVLNTFIVIGDLA